MTKNTEKIAEMQNLKHGTAPDGCLILGKDQSSGECKHITSVRLWDRASQRGQLTQEVLLEKLWPCCGPKMTWYARIWGVLRSEAFLVFLHIVILMIGMMKQFVHTEEMSEELHLMHAVCETFLTCIILIIRAFVSKQRFHRIKECRLTCENVAVDHDTRSYSMKMYIFIQMGVSFALGVFAILSFIVCFLCFHLGWVLFTNNIVIILAAFASGVVLDRLDWMVLRLKQDHLRIISYESLMIIEELLKGGHDSNSVRERALNFSTACREEKFLKKPSYIQET